MLIRGAFNLVEMFQPFIGCGLGEVSPHFECSDESKCKAADVHHSAVFLTVSAEGRFHWHISRDIAERKERELIQVSRLKCCH